jgi:hypothetical protein
MQLSVFLLTVFACIENYAPKLKGIGRAIVTAKPELMFVDQFSEALGGRIAVALSFDKKIASLSVTFDPNEVIFTTNIAKYVNASVDVLRKLFLVVAVSVTSTTVPLAEVENCVEQIQKGFGVSDSNLSVTSCSIASNEFQKRRLRLVFLSLEVASQQQTVKRLDEWGPYDRASLFAFYFPIPADKLADVRVYLKGVIEHFDRRLLASSKAITSALQL